jgi:hypothetical protein
MYAMIIPFWNIILDIVFYKSWVWNACATLATISYFMCFLLRVLVFDTKVNAIKSQTFQLPHHQRNFSTQLCHLFKTRRCYSRHNTQSLYFGGGETFYCCLWYNWRMLMFALSRFRITQGFIPIAGYNYGAL